MRKGPQLFVSPVRGSSCKSPYSNALSADLQVVLGSSLIWCWCYRSVVIHLGACCKLSIFCDLYNLTIVLEYQPIFKKASLNNIIYLHPSV